MVNFRFHIVSLIAVFLALALGIGMGVTVIDKATVDLLHRQLDAVRSEVASANARSDALNRTVSRNNAYEERSQEYVIDEKLTGVNVVIIAARGFDGGAINETRNAIKKARGSLSGTLWLPEKMQLDDPRDLTELQSDLGSSTSDVTTLRNSFVTKLNAVTAGAIAPTELGKLVDDGYLEWEGDTGGSDVAKISFANARLVIASSVTAVVPNDQILAPLARLISAQPTKRLLLIETGREPDDKTSGQRAVFVGQFRSDPAVANRMSSVDNLETSSGRVATVLALNNLSSGKTGHYGFGQNVDGQIPRVHQ